LQAKNPTFIFVALGGVAEALIIFGVSAFAFKYLVEMFSLGFDIAGIYLGNVTNALFVVSVFCS